MSLTKENVTTIKGVVDESITTAFEKQSLVLAEQFVNIDKNFDRIEAEINRVKLETREIKISTLEMKNDMSSINDKLGKIGENLDTLKIRTDEDTKYTLNLVDSFNRRLKKLETMIGG